MLVILFVDTAEARLNFSSKYSGKGDSPTTPRGSIYIYTCLKFPLLDSNLPNATDLISQFTILRLYHGSCLTFFVLIVNFKVIQEKVEKETRLQVVARVL